MSPSPDHVALSWCLGHIREDLGRADGLLRRQLQAGDAERSALAAARLAIQRVHGVMRFIGMPHVPLLTEACESLMAAAEAREIVLDDAMVGHLASAFQACIAYLEDRLHGGSSRSLHLFPYVKPLLEARAAERVHPADLFDVDLSRRLPLLQEDADTQARADAALTAARGLFERGLLQYLRAPGQPQGVDAMLEAVGAVRGSALGRASHDFWRVAEAFFIALRDAVLTPDVHAKRLLARINLQLRKTIDEQAPIADRLFKDTLFSIACARPGSPRVDDVRRTFELEDAVPADFDMPRFGRVDPPMLARAMEALTIARTAWDRVAQGGPGGGEDAQRAQRSLVEAFSGWPGSGLRALGLALASAFQAVQTPGQRMGEAAALEVATALLCAGHLLDDQAHGRAASGLDAAQERAAHMARRVEGSLAGDPIAEEGSLSWMEALSRRVEDRATMAALIDESMANLRAAEKAIEAFVGTPQARDGLADAQRLIVQVAGALRLLAHDEAADGAQAVASKLAALLSEDAAPSADGLAPIATSLASLGFFVEGLREPHGAIAQFRFDPASGVFSARLGDRSQVAAASVDLPRETMAVGEDPRADGTTPGAAQAYETVLGARAREAEGLIESLRDAPADPLVRDRLRQTLERVRSDAELLDDPLLGRTATEAIALLGSAPPEATDTTEATPAFIEAGPHPVEGDPPIDDSLLATFLEEAQGVLADIAEALATVRTAPADSDPLVTIRRGFHTIKGSSRMVGLPTVGDAGWAMERVLNDWLAERRPATPALLALIESALDEMSAWVRGFFADPAASPDPGALIARAQALEADAQAEVVDDEEADHVEIGGIRVGRSLYMIFLGEADDLLATLVEDCDQWRRQPTRLASARALRAAHSLSGSASLVGLDGVHALADRLEAVYEQQARLGVPLVADDLETVTRTIAQMQAMLHRFAAGNAPRDDGDALAAISALADRLRFGVPPEPVAGGLAPPGVARVTGSMQASPADGSLADASPAQEASGPAAAKAPDDAEVAGRSDAAALSPVPVVADEIDPDLMPVFVEEALDLLPSIAAGLRDWASNPADSTVPPRLMRALHTVKGSARMAGAMSLGQRMHDLETRIEALAVLPSVPRNLIEELIAEHDAAVSDFDRLRAPDAAPAPTETDAAAVRDEPDAPAPSGQDQPSREAAMPSAVSEAPEAGFAAPSAGVALRPLTPVQMVRVRAELLDRLLNEAGEASIARAKVDNELTGLRHSLSELTDNIERLRAHLRELEIQGETQIQARTGATREPDRAFDPLEFDRFTRFQELTRMLAEAVSDVSTVHHNALRGLDEAGQELIRQSQVLRGLQQNLMRVRMVQFGTVADRLYRIVRQAAKETGKRVDLDVRGSGVEIDRSVLEAMTGALEHLLRNAVAHGIESREQRLAAGKREVGEIAIEARQEGNEVVLSLADDGAGLDLQRVRQRAMANGLLPADAQPTERELVDLIFAPGLSTAEQVTELSGRGVGMDVVRAQAAALGGRIETETRTGRGTRFTIRLPASLAVAQVVLVALGDTRYAVPAASVEQVIQFRPQAMADAHAQGHVERAGQRIPLFWIGALVDAPASKPISQPQSSVVILRSGGTRIALHADSVSRGQEVVMKNPGPQVSRVRGVSGATVLGNGEVVLIVNPVVLAQSVVGDALEGRAPGASMAQGASARIDASPTVMVVDDSVTVRKVTQRLLERAGYQVLLAKDGVDALGQLEDTAPDVMLVDVEMPRMDGFDLTRRVRADERLRRMPIIMITSRTGDKHRNLALSVGVDVFLGKPYDEADLLARVEGFTLARRSAARGAGSSSSDVTAPT